MLCPTMAVVAILTASLGFAPAPVFRERPDPKGLIRQMQGTWELNTSVGPGGRRSTLVRIKDNTWTYVFVTNEVESEGTPTEITLGSERDLTTLDLRMRNPDPGVPFVLRGIVKIEGKVLSACYSPAKNAKRPRAFAETQMRVENLRDEVDSPVTMTLRKVR
jgi:uncharacterized protein (TIGR03067 family)